MSGAWRATTCPVARSTTDAFWMVYRPGRGATTMYSTLDSIVIGTPPPPPNIMKSPAEGGAGFASTWSLEVQPVACSERCSFWAEILQMM
ncbi:MAG: hypothetical protein U0325_28305 [Polyangiales bacterium]